MKHDTEAVLNKLLTEPDFLRKVQNPMINAIKDSNGDGDIIPILKLLLLYGADIDEKHNTETILFKCCLMHVRTEVIKFLLDNGANPFLPNQVGYNPLQLVSSLKKREFIEVLLQDGCYRHLSEKAVRLGGPSCFDLFLKYGYKITTDYEIDMIKNNIKFFHIIYGHMDPETKFEDIPFIKELYNNDFHYIKNIGPLTAYLVNKFKSFLKPPNLKLPNSYWTSILPYIERLYAGVDRKTKFDEIPYLGSFCRYDLSFNFMAERFDFFFQPPLNFNCPDYWAKLCTKISFLERLYADVDRKTKFDEIPYLERFCRYDLSFNFMAERFDFFFQPSLNFDCPDYWAKLCTKISFLKRLYQGVDRKTKFDEIPYLENVFKHNFKGMFPWFVDRFDFILEPSQSHCFFTHYWRGVFQNTKYIKKVFENKPLNSLEDIPCVEEINFGRREKFDFFVSRGVFERTPPAFCVKLFIKVSKNKRELRKVLKNFTRLGKEIGDLEQYLPLRMSTVKVLLSCGGTTDRFQVSQEIEKVGYCNICYTDRDKFRQCNGCKNYVCVDCSDKVLKCPFCRKPKERMVDNYTMVHPLTRDIFTRVSIHGPWNFM
jgi:hypothetical protein